MKNRIDWEPGEESGRNDPPGENIQLGPIARNRPAPYFMGGLYVWDRRGTGPELKNMSDSDLMMYQELLSVFYLEEAPLSFDLGDLMNKVEGRVSCMYGKHTLTEYRRLIRVLGKFFEETANGYVPRYSHSRFINPETDIQGGKN